MTLTISYDEFMANVDLFTEGLVVESRGVREELVGIDKKGAAITLHFEAEGTR